MLVLVPWVGPFLDQSILVPGGTKILLGGGVPKTGNYILVPRGTKMQYCLRLDFPSHRASRYGSDLRARHKEFQRQKGNNFGKFWEIEIYLKRWGFFLIKHIPTPNPFPLLG